MNDDILRHYGLRDPFPDKWEDAHVALPAALSANEPDALGTGQSIASILTGRGLFNTESAIAEEYSLGSKGFNARNYVRDVHGKATQNDLRRGQEYLQNAIESKSGSLKMLVEDNFDRFVGSKRVIDNVYAQITSDFRKSDSSASRIDILRTSINNTSARAAQVFEPLIETRRKADRLRSTIGMLEQYKPHFDLPSVLLGCIERQDNDALLRAYKKGQLLFKDVRRSAGVQHPTSTTEKRNARILYRVWIEVEKIMRIHESSIWKAIDAENADIDHERISKLANFLLDIGVDRNPYHRAYSQNLISLKSVVINALEVGRTHVEILRRNLCAKHNSTRADRIQILRTFVTNEKSPSVTNGSVVQSKEALRFWSTVSDLVEHVWTERLRNAVENWRIFQDMTSSRATKLLPNGPEGSSRRFHIFTPEERDSAIARMEEAVQLLCHSIADFFNSRPISAFPSTYSPLSANQTQSPSSLDDAPVLPPKSEQDQAEFSFIPVDVNSLSASIHLGNVMQTLLNGATELYNLQISEKVNHTLQTMIISVRERLIRALCELWQADCEDMPYLESWDRLTDVDGTDFPHTCWILQKAIIQAVEKLMFVNGSKSALLQNPSARLLGNIRQQFVKNIYQVINGLMTSSSTTDTSEKELGDAVVHDSLPRKKLLMLQNLAHFQASTLLKLVQQFESSFSVAQTEDLQKLNAMIKQYDAKLFSAYLKPYIQHIETTIDTDCRGVRWTAFPMPEQVSVWTNEVVLQVILVHSQVLATTPSLRPRIIETLISHIFNHLLTLLQDVPEFNTGAILQLTLDLEFLGIQFNDSLPLPATRQIERIFEIIESRTSREREVTPAEKVDAKKVLARARNGQTGQARVFRQR